MPIKQKVNRNVSIVALYICGFPINDIARLLQIKRRNAQMFLKKYLPRYKAFVMTNISNFMTKKQGYKRSEGNRWNKTLRDLEKSIKEQK